MLKQQDFNKKVWNKYESYTNEKTNNKKFFTKNLYKDANYLLCAKSISLFLIVIVFTAFIAGGAYAGIKNTLTPKVEYIQEDTIVKDAHSLGGALVEGMDYEEKERIYYKKINTYEEFKRYKDTYNNFIDMEESDFNNYFVIVFLGTIRERQGLYVGNIEVTDYTIKVDIGRDLWKDNQLVFAKILKENDRENVEVKFINPTANMENYTKLDELPQEYTVEQAIKDNCVVIENRRYLSRPYALREFIKKTENGEKDSIRVVQNHTNAHPKGMGMIIIDIEFRDGEYIVNSDHSRYAGTGGNEEYYYYYFKTEKIENHAATGAYKDCNESYVLNGERGEQEDITIMSF